MQERLLRLVSNLRPRSLLSLKQALDIREAEGVAATLIIQIPADPAKAVEVFMTTAPMHLVADLSRILT